MSANTTPGCHFDLCSGKDVDIVIVPGAVTADIHGAGGVFLQTDLARLCIDNLYLQRGGINAVGRNRAGRDVRTVDGSLARGAECRKGHIAG